MAYEKIGKDGFIVTGEHINAFRMLALRNALKMETVGLKNRAPVTKIVRGILKSANYAAPQNKVKLLAAYEFFLREQGFMM